MNRRDASPDTRFSVTNGEAIRRRMRRHYRLTRRVTEREIRAEVRGLLRLRAAGLLDDRTGYLWASISPYVALPPTRTAAAVDPHAARPGTPSTRVQKSSPERVA